MTDNKVLEKARAKIRAEHAAYMREWRKKNPDKVKASIARSKQKKLERVCMEVGKNAEQHY